ncbi:MAG: ABC transporter ATP-binding protein [Candidatus Marinimicrobia bacterium]|nr:ABC transporter ATP-binding protein [Candidatus Neomarinimicrobiota bacterium]
MFKKLIITASHYLRYVIPGLIFSLLFSITSVASFWIVTSLIQTIFSPEPVTVNASVEFSFYNFNDFLKFAVHNFISNLSKMDAIKQLSILITIIFVTKNIFFYLKKIIFGKMELLIINDTRNKLYSHIAKQSMDFFDKRSRGEFMSIIMNDVSNYKLAISTIFNELLTESLTVLFVVYILFDISLIFSYYMLIIFPLTGILFWLVGASIRRKGHRSLKQISVITSFLQQMLGAVRLIKTFNKVSDEIKNFSNNNLKYLQVQFRKIKLSAISSPVSELIGVGIGILILLIGGKMVFVEQNMDAEDFLRYIILLFSILKPIKTLTKLNVKIQTGLSAADRIHYILNTPIKEMEKPNAKKIYSFNNKIEFKNVYFSYEKQPVLTDISFTIPKGKTFALVGSSGSGKSTIADLLSRFYLQNRGSISIDDNDLQMIQANSLHKIIGIVSQDVQLLNDTVFYNIAYGDPTASIEDIKLSAEIANAREFIENLENGWDTIVGEQGVRLSGGQRQRISIARTLLLNPSILILDEATSSLDTESERIVQKSIDKLMQGRTSLVIAHRLSTILNADQIIVLENGKILCQGKHEDLLENCPKYESLYFQQFNKKMDFNDSE